MGDEIAGLRLIHGELGGGFPCFERRIVIGKHADNTDIVGVFERGALGADQLPSEYEVKTLGHCNLRLSNCDLR